MADPLSTVSIESQRRNYKIAHVVLNIVCIILIANVCSEYSLVKDFIEHYHGKEIGGQTSCRIAFLLIVIALTLVSLGVLLMHHLSRQRESYVIKPVHELIYYVTSGALLIILSISLIVRYHELQKWDRTGTTKLVSYNSPWTVATIVFGFIDAIAYLVPGFLVWRSLRQK